MEEQIWLARLAEQLDAVPSQPVLAAHHTYIHAAVLVPIILRPTGITLLLTQRAAHLYHHPGQISFPGGKVEQQDINPIATALRETYEEIGLDQEHVQVLGYSAPCVTGTGFVIDSVVACVSPPFHLQVDDFEVEQIFEVPVSYLKKEQYWSGQPAILTYQDKKIWGATARIIQQLPYLFK